MQDELVATSLLGKVLQVGLMVEGLVMLVVFVRRVARAQRGAPHGPRPGVGAWPAPTRRRRRWGEAPLHRPG